MHNIWRPCLRVILFNVVVLGMFKWGVKAGVLTYLEISSTNVAVKENKMKNLVIFQNI